MEDAKKAMQNYPAHFHRLFELADEVKHGAIAQRDCPTTFMQDLLVLVGDAAHPIHPTHGVGAGMGIEDAGVLGVVLDRDVVGKDMARERLRM